VPAKEEALHTHTISPWIHDSLPFHGAFHDNRSGRQRRKPSIPTPLAHDFMTHSRSTLPFTTTGQAGRGGSPPYPWLPALRAWLATPKVALCPLHSNPQTARAGRTGRWEGPCCVRVVCVLCCVCVCLCEMAPCPLQPILGQPGPDAQVDGRGHVVCIVCVCVCVCVAVAVAVASPQTSVSWAEAQTRGST